MVDIKITDDHLSKFLEAAVINALGDSQKDLIIKEVVDHLVRKPPSGSYGHQSPSPLMAAVYTAADRLAVKIVSEKLENDEDFKAKLDDVLKAALVKVFAEKDNLASKMADAMVTAMSGGSRY